MEKVYTFATEDKEFLFTLNQPIMTEQQDDQTAPFVACKIYRKDTPEHVWTWEGHLNSSEKQAVELTYEDNINFKGYFSLAHSQDFGQNFVFVDFQYGQEHENYFEGNIFVLDA